MDIQYIDQLRKNIGSLYFELTTKCNFACQYCYNNSGVKNQLQLDTTLVKSVIAQAKADQGLKTVIFSGGEPTLHPDFLELCQYAHAMNCTIEIYTNGSLITENLISKLATFNPSFQITLDSFDEIANDSYKGTGSYLAITRGIRLLKSHYNMDNVVVRCNLTTDFLSAKDAVIQYKNLLIQLGVKKAYFSLIMEKGRAESGNYPSAKSIHNLYEFQEYVRSDLSCPELLLDFPFGTCHACPYTSLETYNGEYTLHIASSGDVYPCNGLSYTRHILGNINSDSIYSICTGQKMKEFLAEARHISETFEACKQCAFRRFCGKGCINDMDSTQTSSTNLCKYRRDEILHIIRNNIIKL